VIDDDGGTGSASRSFRVVTPLQAVQEILGLLDGAIAGATNPAVLKDLEKARKALAGNPDGSNGGLREIREGRKAAAIAFLQQAVSWLRQAQTDGAQGGDLTTLITLLELVAQSLSAA
jgi:hypothetical protein